MGWGCAPPGTSQHPRHFASPCQALAALSPRGEHPFGQPGTHFWPERGALAVGVTPQTARVPVPQPGAAHGDLTRPVPTQPAQLCPDKH